DYDSMKAVETINLVTLGGVGVDTVTFNFDPAKPPSKMFSDKAVRQALYYALDREALVRAVYFGHGAPANGIILPDSWAYNKNVTPTYTYDKAKAESILDAAGWRKGPDGIRAKGGIALRWQIDTNPGYTKHVEILQAQWKDIGCDVTTRVLTPSTLIDEILNSRNFDMILINFGPSVEDPDISIYVHSRNTVKGGINGWNYRNPDLDKLLEDATATIDRSKRKDIYTRIQNLMAEEVPVMPLVVPFSTLAVSK